MKVIVGLAVVVVAVLLAFATGDAELFGLALIGGVVAAWD